MKYIRLARLALALTPLSLSLAALPAPAAAQAPPAAPSSGLPPGAPPLTIAQQQQQAARIARARQDAAAVYANSALSPAQKQQQLQTMQAALDKDMLAILTPAQQQAVLKQRTLVTGLRAQFDKDHQAEYSKGRTLDAQLQKSITPQQKRKMAAIQQQAQQQLKTLLSDPKATPQVKQQTGGAIQRNAVREQLAVMTPAQQSQIKQLQTISTHLTQERAAFAKAHGQQ